MMLCGLLVRPPLVIVIYRPQAVGLSPEIFLDDFSTLLEELIVCSEELLIMGDFNLHIDDIENTQAVRFISLLDSFGLKQHVVSPTHRGGHILDLVITRDDCVALEVSNICVLEQPVSDHKPIWFNLNLEKQSNQRKTVVSRRLKNFDCESFNIRITSSGLLNMDDDTSLSALVNNYDTVLCGILDELAPVKTRSIIVHPNALWYNDEIADAKKKRRRLERKWRSNRLDCNRANYLAQCDVVNKMLHKAREEYYSTIIRDNAHDQKVLFQTVEKLLQKSSDRRYPLANSDRELADAFADYFVTKIDGVRQDVLARKKMAGNSPGEIDEVTCTSNFSSFDMLTEEDVVNLIGETTIKSCSLDPAPAIIMKKCYITLVPRFRRIINLSLSLGAMPEDLKIAILSPLLKSPTLI